MRRTFENHTPKLAQDLAAWWRWGYGDEVKTFQKAKYSPHHLTTDEGDDVGRQKLDAWLRRDWVWCTRDLGETNRKWVTLVTTVHLTAEGESIVRSLREDASAMPPDA
ncbi:MAG: hypothetical protein JSV81_03995 [Anaerolineales bacterium]|nr:MAG: hypothetical protein JSV81_03995 [Anaerolineales bacterium]